MNYLNIYKEESKSIFKVGFQKLHAAIGIKDYMPVEYYDGIKKLFNNLTEEFFVEVITHLVINYRGRTMPSSNDFKDSMKSCKESMHMREIGIAKAEVKKTPLLNSYADYEKEAMRIFYQEYPEYRGVLKYDQDPKTEKQCNAAKTYFKILQKVHGKYNPNSIFSRL